MATCPECEKKVDHLRTFSRVEQAYVFKLGSDGMGSYFSTGASYSLDIPDDYECPECANVLFTDEEMAQSFLLGE